MDAPYSTSSGILNRLFLAKQQEGTTPILKFGVSRGSREEYSTLLPITTWKPGEWRGVDISWMSTRLVLQVEKEGQSQIILPTTIQNGNILTFYPIDAAIDNLSILSGNSQITRTFDGDINK